MPKFTEANSENKLSLEAIKQVQSAAAYSKQKMYYLTLTPEEKHFIWIEKLQQVEADVTLTTQQKGFITKVISFLKPELFGESISIADSQIMTTLRKEAIALFGKRMAGEIFTTLEEIKPASIDAVQDAEYPPGTGDCDCNKSDDWCQGDDKCVRVGCSESSSGCGWFWQQPCNGDCWPVPGEV